MPIITIAQSKGGAGKSTVALALASEFFAAGGTVAILDADRQLSLLRWYREREASGTNVPEIRVEDASAIGDDKIGHAIARAAETADLVIVDTEGTANMKTAYAAQDSDFVIVPTRSSRLDLERTVETQVMLDRMCRGTPYRVLVTQTPSAVRSGAELEIDRQIREKLPTFDVQMHMLDAFRAMFNYRKTLREVDDEGLARAEKARVIAKNILKQCLVDISKREAA